MSPARPEPLFDPTSTVAAKCPACHAVRKLIPELNACRYDQDNVRPGWSKRPRGCLNSAQNRDGIPY